MSRLKVDGTAKLQHETSVASKSVAVLTQSLPVIPPVAPVPAILACASACVSQVMLVPASFTSGKAKHCVPGAHCDNASLAPEHCANCPLTQTEVPSVQGEEAVSVANCALSFCASNPFWSVKEARLTRLEESTPASPFESLPESWPPGDELPVSPPTGLDEESPPTGPDELESPPMGPNEFSSMPVVVPFSLSPESPLESLPSSRRSKDSFSSSPSSTNSEGSGWAKEKLTDGLNVGATEIDSTGALMLENGVTVAEAKDTVSDGLYASLVDGVLSETLEN